MFLLKKIVNTQLRGLLTKMAVNITQLLTKTIIAEILCPTSQTYIKKSENHPHKGESDQGIMTGIYFYSKIIFPFLRTRLS